MRSFTDDSSMVKEESLKKKTVNGVIWSAIDISMRDYNNSLKFCYVKFQETY